jgi:DNA-directed RNA polymerase subunit RPC12/RpoP
MDVVKCPSCKRALRLPNEFRDSLVRCPSCSFTFKAETQPISVEQLPLAAPPVRVKAEAIAVSVNIEEFDEDAPKASQSVPARLRTAAGWLRIAGTLHFAVLSLAGCFTLASAIVPLIIIWIAQIVLLLAMFLGAHQLVAKRSYQTAMVGLVAALVIGLCTLALSIPLLIGVGTLNWLYSTELALLHSGVTCLFLSITICTFIGGAMGLSGLSAPEAKHYFDA